MDDLTAHTLAESDSYAIWTTVEDNGETIYHLELGSVTLHFFQEEWEELVGLLEAASAGSDGKTSGKSSGNTKKRR